MRGDKQYTEIERTITVWKLYWVIKNKIREMVFDDRQNACNLMFIHLKQKRCSWIEKLELKRHYRIYNRQ